MTAARLAAPPGESAVYDPPVEERELTLALGEGQDATLWTLPIAEKCAVTINGRQFLGDKLLIWRDDEPEAALARCQR